MVWAGMGMGKTSSTLAALRILLDCLAGGPALIIAPLRVAQSTWPDEVAKWGMGFRVSVVCGTAARRLEALRRKADIYCTNYENLPWLVAQFEHWPFSVVVCDEATRLKGYRIHSGGARAHALAMVAYESPRFIELTGTPTANGLLDLWGQAWFVDRGERLGKTLSAYQQGYFFPVRTGGEAYMVRWDPQPGAAEKIREKLKDIALTINAEDWFDIKQPIVTDIEVDLPPKAITAYRSMERDLLLSLGGADVEAVNALSAMNKCLQIAGGALYTDEETRRWERIHDAKLEALASIISEANGAPVLVAYQYKHEAVRILEKFKGARLLDKNPATIRAWNAGRIPVLVAHPTSCGHGLNLQDGGSILVFFGLGYNYEQYAQMCERIGPTRQAQSGHPRSVFIYRILAKGTLDRSVVRALRDKRDLLDFLLEKRK